MTSAQPGKRAMLAWSLVVLLLSLAACAGGGDWKKPGVDAATEAADYRECRGASLDSVKTEADIDQDIAAARQTDLQRAGAVRQQSEMMQGKTSDRADAIVTACMRAMGYTRQR